jgi:hypothetical protein
VQCGHWLFPSRGHEAVRCPWRGFEYWFEYCFTLSNWLSRYCRITEEVKLEVRRGAAVVEPAGCGTLGKRIGKRIRGSDVLTVLYAKVKLFHHFIIYSNYSRLTSGERLAGGEMRNVREAVRYKPRTYLSTGGGWGFGFGIYGGWNENGHHHHHHHPTTLRFHNLVRQPINPLPAVAAHAQHTPRSHHEQRPTCRPLRARVPHRR